MYLSTPSEWDDLVRRLADAAIIGLDTEFYGVDVRRQSTCNRARVHVFSLAEFTGKRSPRGHYMARGYVLPAEALPAVAPLLTDSSLVKVVHNRAVDDHALASHGIRLAGAVNSLSLARWCWPELVRGGGFGLKALMLKLGKLPVAEFGDVVRYTREELTSSWVKKRTRVCSCGEEGCRKRNGHDKVEVEETVEVVRTRTVRDEYPLESIVPGHPRWELLVEYAAEDAVSALELYSLLVRTSDPAAFPFAPVRPAFPDAVDEAVIRMERTGIPTDPAGAGELLARATVDEATEDTWLRSWHRANVPGETTDEDVDAIWDSPVKKLALFDAVGFPRSPVWQKGAVKRGDAKMDNVAQEWIGRRHPPARDVIDHLIRRQRVRAGKKYLEKIAANAPVIHPICGPAGDADDRNGAVTGRLGIKGELEAQQLPAREDKDLYQLRRYIAAPAGETLVVADYAALEVVILADLAIRLFGDHQLAGMVAAGAPDIHSVNARAVFGTQLGWTLADGRPVADVDLREFKGDGEAAGLRQMVKTVWYGLQYGKGAWGFASLEDGSGTAIGEERAGAIVDALLSAVPALGRWQAWCRDFVDAHRGIYSPDGRWCDLSEEMDGDTWLRQRAYRRAYNFPMQAGGAGIVGDAMVRLMSCPDLAATGHRVCLQVHDELVLRGPEATATRAGELLVAHMAAATYNGVPLVVPLRASVGIGRTYYDAK